LKINDDADADDDDDDADNSHQTQSNSRNIFQNSTQSNPIQSNPWMNQIHGHLFLGERHKLSRVGVRARRAAPTENWFWCILSLKENIW